ncbi:unnamed protein product [Diplocarpon coronariae]|uniref:Thioesterase domain-containing protein n=1 Tax=Diplocarpon coronariae TaxID=2795749 RepID=A0A218YX84_9HELO|nr:hypothetical protein JHW43_001309 [Diplocarpon mali]OWO99384.1 hypothetical protein B2J93_8781 [Marssonina coronariae]
MDKPSPKLPNRDPFHFQSPEPRIRAQFAETPWTDRYFNDPNLHACISESRISKLGGRDGNTADTLCAVTLAKQDTILAWQYFYKPASSSPPLPPSPPRSAPLSPPLLSSTQPSPSSQLPSPASDEILALLKLGRGLNGHIDTAHGGLLCVILDEMIGNAAEYQRSAGTSTMTAYLNVTYRKPVSTPGTVLVRAWVERVEGRKIFGRGVVEDGEGVVCASGEALFLSVPRIQGRPGAKM